MRKGIGFCLALLFMVVCASYSADPPKPSEEQINEFLRAIKSGDMAFVTDVLERDPESASRENSHGITPLMCAMYQDQEEMVKLLVSKGADVNAKDGPLSTAAYEGRVSTVEYLIANGARIDQTNYWGGTPLASAAEGGRLEVARLLISKGANINAKDEFGKTPLYIAVNGGRPGVAKLLIEKGADVNQANSSGTSPLHQATSAYVATLLIANGAKVGATDKNGVTPLHTAAAFGRAAVIQILLQKGADVSANTTAAGYLDTGLRGPDVTFTAGVTPRELAEKAGQKEAAKLLTQP